MKRIRGLVVTSVAVAGFAGSALGAAAQTPEATPAALAPFDPSNVVATVDNPYFPLVPGTVFTYEGNNEDATERDVATVLSETKTILGIPCVVVHDVVYDNGELAEDTLDWYVQDKAGNVWYMGEDSKKYENGKVTSTEGSWQAGVDGALPGIIMPAESVVGQAYEQEYYPGQAEDMAKAIELNATVTIGLGTYDHVLVNQEWSPLEPEVLEEKSYAPGIGLIKVVSVKGENSALELTAITGPGATPEPSPSA